MSVSKTELIWQAETWEKIQPGGGKSEVGRFSTQPLLKLQWDIGHVALPKASTRCQPSLETCLMLLLWRGAEWEGNESEVCQQSRTFHMQGISRSFAFLKTKEFSGWNIIVKNILKIVSIHRLTSFYGLSRNGTPKGVPFTLWIVHTYTIHVSIVSRLTNPPFTCLLPFNVNEMKWI